MSKFIKFMSTIGNRTYGFINGVGTMIGILTTVVAVFGTLFIVQHREVLIDALKDE